MEDESSPSPAAPEFFDTAGYYAVVDSKNADHFAVDDLLDFPNDDTPDAAASPPPPPSCNSSLSAAASADPHFDIGAGSPAGHFSGELSVPYEELAELEWLSRFVEESFSSEGLHKLHLIQGTKARNDAASGPTRPETVASGPTFRPEVPVPGKARSKRSRAAPGNWTSRLLAVAPAPASAPAVSSSSESDASARKPWKPAGQRKREGHDGGGEGRKCLHCATDKTPQWRTGPMGPKTLCNACGVRYKSGRLVPEYRPAASPTFTLTKHSNSHRKVMELRRQKEMQRGPQLPPAAAPPPPAAAPPPPPYLHHHLHQNVVFDVPNGDDYLIHHHVGPDYRQLT